MIQAADLALDVKEIALQCRGDKRFTTPVPQNGAI